MSHNIRSHGLSPPPLPLPLLSPSSFPPLPFISPPPFLFPCLFPSSSLLSFLSLLSPSFLCSWFPLHLLRPFPSILHSLSHFLFPSYPLPLYPFPLFPPPITPPLSLSLYLSRPCPLPPPTHFLSLNASHPRPLSHRPSSSPPPPTLTPSSPPSRPLSLSLYFSRPLPLPPPTHFLSLNAATPCSSSPPPPHPYPHPTSPALPPNSLELLPLSPWFVSPLLHSPPLLPHLRPPPPPTRLMLYLILLPFIILYLPSPFLSPLPPVPLLPVALLSLFLFFFLFLPFSLSLFPFLFLGSPPLPPCLHALSPLPPPSSPSPLFPPLFPPSHLDFGVAICCLPLPLSPYPLPSSSPLPLSSVGDWFSRFPSHPYLPPLPPLAPPCLTPSPLLPAPPPPLSLLPPSSPFAPPSLPLSLPPPSPCLRRAICPNRKERGGAAEAGAGFPGGVLGPFVPISAFRDGWKRFDGADVRNVRLLTGDVIVGRP
ncbi:hypothetical protein C7M84_012512 [Penaeus vannamei]|uniref:Uncharacterized protein n=1 Tax=Penaeus vannamei TaxID=6689 RepID=A0A3R7M7K9_PENVA|nr:hypothetical protein C7M84_012512 [Penaeus vannamei]